MLNSTKPIQELVWSIADSPVRKLLLSSNPISIHVSWWLNQLNPIKYDRFHRFHPQCWWLPKDFGASPSIATRLRCSPRNPHDPHLGLWSKPLPGGSSVMMKSRRFSWRITTIWLWLTVRHGIDGPLKWFTVLKNGGSFHLGHGYVK